MVTGCPPLLGAMYPTGRKNHTFGTDREQAQISCLDHDRRRDRLCTLESGDQARQRP